MKFKTSFIVLSSLMTSALLSNAATFLVSNVVNGPGDTLYADNNNVLLGSGISAIGYFTSTVSATDVDSIGELQSQLLLGSFTTVASATDFTGGGLGNGYVDGTSGAVTTATIGLTDPLLGRTIYVITTNQATLLDFANGTGPNNQVALVNFGTIVSDVPLPQLYNGNPVAPASVVLGGSGTYTESAGGYLGDGVYNTLTLAAIPEPTTALLGAFGAIALLRRRRN
jgi:hypothetical protein